MWIIKHLWEQEKKLEGQRSAGHNKIKILGRGRKEFFTNTNSCISKGMGFDE